MRNRLVAVGVAAVLCSLAALRAAIELHNGVFVVLAATLAVMAIRKTILVYRSF